MAVKFLYFTTLLFLLTFNAANVQMCAKLKWLARAASVRLCLAGEALQICAALACTSWPHQYTCMAVCGCAARIKLNSWTKLLQVKLKKKIHEIVTKNCCLPFTFCVCMPVCMLASVTLFLLVVGRQLSCCETIEISSANTFLVFNIVACTFQHKLI